MTRSFKRCLALTLALALTAASFPARALAETERGSAPSGFRIFGRSFSWRPPTLKPSVLPAAVPVVPPAAVPEASASLAEAAREIVSAPSDAAGTPRVAGALDALYSERRGAGDSATTLAAPGAPSSEAGLSPASGPLESRRLEPPLPPRGSFKDSMRAGLGGSFWVFVSAVSMFGVLAAGYRPHSNYKGTEILDKIAALPLFVTTVVTAPLMEEVLFRGGVMRGLRWAARKVGRGRIASFWVPAVLSSLVFAAAHETSDPVLFFVRMVATMGIAYAFDRGGLTGSMTTHAILNFSIASGIVFTTVFGTGFGVGMAALSLLGLFGWGAYEFFRRKPAAKAAAPYQLSAKAAAVCAILLFAGAWLIRNEPLLYREAPVCVIFGLGYLIYAARRWIRNGRPR